MMDLIRNRPVFNEELLLKGNAIKYRQRDNKKYDWTEWKHALIMDIELNSITLGTVDGDYVEESDFTIEEMINEEFELELLK